MRPAATLKLTNATVEAALAALGPRASALGTKYSLFSGTTDKGIFYGAMVFTNLTTRPHTSAARSVCRRVAAALNTTLPAAYFARPSIGKTRIITGTYDPLDPDGLCELPAAAMSCLCHLQAYPLARPPACSSCLFYQPACLLDWLTKQVGLHGLSLGTQAAAVQSMSA